MTPTTIICKAMADGVQLALSATGNIKASGDQLGVEKWLPTIRAHKPEIIEALQDAANDSDDAVPDDRCTCRQCQQLRARVCTVAKPSGLVSANRGYKPNPETLQRCAGYLPNDTDSDQRTGLERWPGLVDCSEGRTT